MARTNPGLVQKLLDADWKAGRNTAFAIDTATALVDDLMLYAAASGYTVADSRAELIERWLACHAYVQSDQALANKSQGGASGSYQGQTGMYLEGSKYGQMAMVLDSTGYLRLINSQSTVPRVTGRWLGKPRSQQRTYEERNG